MTTAVAAHDSRGMCPRCGRVVHVRLDGLLRLHRRHDRSPCEGLLIPAAADAVSEFADIEFELAPPPAPRRPQPQPWVAPLATTNAGDIGRAARQIQNEWDRETWRPQDRSFHLSVSSLLLAVTWTGDPQVHAAAQAVADAYMNERTVA